MKRNTLAQTALGIGLAAASLLCHATELTYNSALPSTHVLHKKGMNVFAEQVAADSKGEVTFKLMVGGSIAKPGAAVDVLRDGIVNTGHVTDVYARKSLPTDAMLSDLALLGTDTLVMVGATNEFRLLHCEGCKKEVAKNSIIPLAYSSTTPYLLMCKDELKSLADIKGKKVRATSAWGLLLKDLGMIPVNISSSEAYEAMQRGQVDCVSGSDAWLKSYTLWDVVRSVVDFPMGTFHGTMIFSINNDSWAGLSPLGKQAILKNLPDLVANGAFAYEEERLIARKGAEEKDVKYVKPAQDLVDAYRAYTKGYVENVIEAGEKANVKGARKEVEGFVAMIDKWTGIVAQTKGDKAAYREALYREIFSKLNLK